MSFSFKGSGGGSVRTTTTTTPRATSRPRQNLVASNEPAASTDKSTVDLVDYHSCGKRGLRKGTFQFDNETRGDFVFVPEYYDFHSKSGFLAILTAMGIPFPKFVLNFEKNYGLIPNESKEELEAWLEYEEMSDYSQLKRYHRYSHCAFADPARRDVRAKVLTYKRMTKNFLDGVSEVCSSIDSVYLISEPFRGNELSTLACESASRNGVVSLGLFSADDFSVVVEDDDKEATNKWDLLFQSKDDMSVSEDTIEWRDRKDAQRSRVCKKMFDDETYCVPLGDEPRKAIKISCGLTEYEATYAEKHRGVTCIANGLADVCANRLVFTSKKRRNEFKSIFTDIFPTGAIAGGSNKSELYSMIRCLKDGRPLFILKGTGIVASAAEMFIQRCSTPELNVELVGSQLDRFIPVTADIIPEAKSLLATVRSSLPHYSPDTYESFDVGRDIDLDHMKERISQVIGTVFDFYPEVGGESKDMDVLKYCEKQLDQVKSAKLWYRVNTGIVQYMMRALFIASITLAIIQGSIVKDPTKEQGLSALSGINALKDKSVFEITTLVCVVVATVFHAVDSYMRPSLKYASLLLAQARLESEVFRFKTRTGKYRLLDDDGTKRDIRVLFTKRCQLIFDDCLQSDFSDGSLKFLPFCCKKTTYKYEYESVPKRNRRIKNKLSDEQLLETSPDSSYDLEGGSVKELKHIDSTTSSKSSGSYMITSHQQLSSLFQSPSYGDRCLSFDDYVAQRLQKELNQSESQLPLFTFFRTILQLIVIALTASCALLVIYDKIRWVPIALAGAATSEFFLQFYHLTTRVPVLNASTRALRDVKTWEQGLTHVQTRLPSKKNELVDRCEVAILSRLEFLAFSSNRRDL